MDNNMDNTPPVRSPQFAALVLKACEQNDLREFLRLKRRVYSTRNAGRKFWQQILTTSALGEEVGRYKTVDPQLS